MSLDKQWLDNAFSEYQKAKDLIDNQSKLDPPTRPFKSKYEGQEILRAMLDELSVIDYEDDDDTLHQVNMLKFVLKFELGAVAVETEEMGQGKQLLESAKSFLDDIFPKAIGMIIFNQSVNNLLSFVLCSFDEHKQALAHLKAIVLLYKQWQSIPDKSNFATYDLVDAFKQSLPVSTTQETACKVEKNYTQTLYFLAQVCEKLGLNEESASYCNETLKRQYESDEYEPVDWATNAATLSQYYATQGEFVIASFHLIAASHILRKHESDFQLEQEQFSKAEADISRILVKYCIILFEATEHSSVIRDNPIAALIEKENITDTIPTLPPKSYEEARELFKVGHQANTNAKEYYTLDEHCSDYIDCIFDESKFYRLMAKFEKDKQRICVMHKRRIDMLEALHQAINANYFLAQSRQMQFELGEIYSEMVDIKISIAETTKDANRKSLTKINSLILKGIAHFHDFVNSFVDKKSLVMPSRFDEEMVKPLLVAYFSIGRLKTKLLTNDQREQANNWTSCEHYYKKVNEYIETNPDHESLASEEVNLIREMLQLIPKKMNLILNSTMY